ncbi:MAG: DNA helicase RecQ [Phycisphaerales bacterium]|nr:DNA helicase RecQ [Phycisphaerales bacterium]
MNQTTRAPRSDCASTADCDAAIQSALRKYWGFENLRSQQREAIQAGIDRRDSLVVLPTGGGKSLCYQVPPLVADRVDVVVSPLISLMKDQVDGLRESGYQAVAFYSGIATDDWSRLQREIAAGAYRLIFAAPERLLSDRFVNLMRAAGVGSFAIDEAHCISHWGHDFRPEYRRLIELRRHFPGASMHAFTATATQRVRDDVIAQLQLQNPVVLVGSFDRPNLIYRVIPKTDAIAQTAEILRRHKGEAAIVYCITRRETEDTAAALRSLKFNAAHYHAGMEADERRRTQDAFSEEKLDIVVATVAFGMGIDRSNVRCVIHTSLPKSIEHYQQEAGRAGRDGLAAECALLYSPQDIFRWESLIEKSAGEHDGAAGLVQDARGLLGHIRQFAAAPVCRHRALVEYFGQAFDKDNCGACDVCQGESTSQDETIAAQKILSCVARVQERFGASHVCGVLRGANTQMIRQCGHDRLSTYGLLRDESPERIKDMIYQMIDQGVLGREGGDRPVLKLNTLSWEVMRGARRVRMRKQTDAIETNAAESQTWADVDRGLFDALRDVRRRIADSRSIPAFMVFSDATLRDMARCRPSSLTLLHRISGVSEKKASELGDEFMTAIHQYCAANALSRDRFPATGLSGSRPDRPTDALRKPPRRLSAVLLRAFEMFDHGESIDAVMEAVQRARSTVSSYLEQWIAEHRPADISAWVKREDYQRVSGAITALGATLLKPIFEHLNGEIDYETIRCVKAHLETAEEK